MTFLLGTQECIESLSDDVKDLQRIVNDIYLRLNITPNILSWRSPDMQAYDLDIAELLKKHSFCKHLEENQLSHVVLFELVIDRLVFILQLLRYFLNCKINEVGILSAYSGKSIGTITRKYWNSIDAFMNEFELGDRAKNISFKMDSLVSDPFEEFNFKRTLMEKGCQTLETYYVGCSSCQETKMNLVVMMKRLFHLNNTLLKCETFQSEKYFKIGDGKRIAEDGLKFLYEIEELFIKNEEQYRKLKLSAEEKHSKFESLKNELILLEKNFESLKESKEIKIKNLKKIIQEMTLKYEIDCKEKFEKSDNKFKTLQGKLDFAESSNIKHETSQMETWNQLKSEETVNKEEIKMLTSTLKEVSKKLSEVCPQFMMEQDKNHNHHLHYQFLKSKQVSMIRRLENMDADNLKLHERAMHAERLTEQMEIEVKELKIRLEEIQNGEEYRNTDGLKNKTINCEITDKKQEIEFMQNILRHSKSRSRTNFRMESINEQDPSTNQKIYSDVTEHNFFDNTNSVKLLKGGRSISKMSQLKDDIDVGKWICEFCGEHCNNNSDLSLHISYCVFKI